MSKKLFVATNTHPRPSREFLAELNGVIVSLKESQGWDVITSFDDESSTEQMEQCDAFVGILKEPGEGLGPLALKACEELGIPAILARPEGESYHGLALEGPYFYPQDDHVEATFADLESDLPRLVQAHIR